MNTLRTATCLAALVTLATGCATARPAATIRGADLYAKVADLRHDGRTIVQSSAQQDVAIHRGQFLVDPVLEQIFEVNQVISNCTGDPSTETDCTLVLLREQTFTVHDEAPAPRALPDEEGDDMSFRTKVILFTGVTTALLGYGAAKCDAFDGCGTVLGLAAAIDGLVFLLAAACGGGCRD
jgi:hypothetical protein